MPEKILLSYFTPTYNREKLLPNLYKSLLRQTNKNFIWLVVDDGSKDNTQSLIEDWQKENKINISYYKKENGGKHTTIDFANNVCKTNFICCIDSDDYLTDNATDILYEKFAMCKDEDCCGLVGPKTILNAPKNNVWNVKENKIKFYDLEKILGFIPETTIVLKTDIAKKFHFPTFANEKFVTESVYYQQFLYDYFLATFDKEVYIAEYQPDGYTNMGLNLFVKSPLGYAYAQKQNLYYAIKLHKSFKQKIKKTMLLYGWLKAMKINKNFTKDYNIPWFYRFVGTITCPLSKAIIKKRLKSGK